METKPYYGALNSNQMVNIPDLIQQLKENVKSYPKEIEPILADIQDTAFFPGGSGVFANSEVTRLKIMIVGQDFGTESEYKKLKEYGRTSLNQNPTWRNLIKLLEDAGVNKENCFFTNAIMGVRKNDRNMGRSIAFNKDENNRKFLEECRNFFLLQINFVSPDKILLLGRQLIEFIEPLSEKLNDWKNIKRFSDIDKNEIAVKKNVSFQINDTEIVTTIVALTHPCMLRRNVKGRKYREQFGYEAMIKMIQEK